MGASGSGPQLIIRGSIFIVIPPIIAFIWLFVFVIIVETIILRNIIIICIAKHPGGSDDRFALGAGLAFEVIIEIIGSIILLFIPEPTYPESKKGGMIAF